MANSAQKHDFSDFGQIFMAYISQIIEVNLEKVVDWVFLLEAILKISHLKMKSISLEEYDF